MNPESFFSPKAKPTEKKSFNSLVFTLPALFILLLIFLKLPVLEIYFNTINLIITLAPMVAILGVYFYAYHKQRKNQAVKRLDYYLLILKILLAILVFYLIYSPQDFLSFFSSLFRFLGNFLSLEGLIYLSAPLALIIFIAFTLYFLYQYFNHINGDYQGSLPKLFRKLSFTLFFVLLFLGSGVVLAKPQAIKPLTDYLGDTIFTLSGGNIHVLKGTDVSQYKKLSSLKDATQSLTSSLKDTSANLSQTVEENKITFQETISESKLELQTTISETTDNLKDKLEEDIEDRLSLSGGTLSGKLTVNKDLTVEGSATLEDTLTAEDILPEQSGLYSLGSSSKGWSNLYVSRIKGSSPVIIGDGSSALDLSDSGDLVVSEQLEVLGDTNLQNLTLEGEVTMNANSILNDYILSITADKISDIIPITKGGTGASTTTGALNALLPAQTSQANQFLQTDGTNASWQAITLSDLQNPTADLNLDLDDYTMKFNFIANSGTDNLFTLRDKDNNTGTGYLLDVYTGDNSLLNPFRVSADDRNLIAIAVDSLGQVGIGTDDINNNLSILGDMDLIGNFGIGISSPEAPFHISSTSNPQFQISHLSQDFNLNLDSNGDLNFSIDGDSYVFDKKIEATQIFSPNLTTYREGDGRVGDAYCQRKEVSDTGVVGDWTNINNDQVCGLNKLCDAGSCIETDFVCGTSQVADADGNPYDTVRIGDQCWMASNLNVGSMITSCSGGYVGVCTDNGETSNLPTEDSTIEKYCYNDTESNCDTYGGLYNWNEAMGYSTTEGVQGICPDGWHIPTDAEQYELENYLTTEGNTCDATRNGVWDCDDAGTDLKTGGSSGFEALLAGYRNTNGSFNNLSSHAYFWSSSQNSSTRAWRRYLNSSNTTVYRYFSNKEYGFSVRCLKD
jgi:uncharacterized protein (TIGR02145 family)